MTVWLTGTPEISAARALCPQAYSQRLLLDVIGAAVIGGASLFGGRGKIVWTFYGVLFLTLIDNRLNLAGHSHFTIMMVKGGVILLAALLNVWRRR